MIPKLLIALLTLTVVGAAGIGLIDAVRPPSVEPLAAESLMTDQADVLASEAQDTAPGAAPEAQAATPTTPAATSDAVQRTQTQSHTGQTGLTGDGAGPLNTSAALGMVGQPWADSGTILSLDEAGFTLRMADGSEQYVELGPAMYWQAQPVTLTVGDSVSISGFDNGQQIHAGMVTTAAGQELALRTAEGLPLWSGGTQGNGNAGQGEVQVAPDAWVTLSGTVTGMQGANLTITTQDSEILTLQLGQPQFTAEQNIAFAIGDTVDVIGFWEGAQFRAGEIRKTGTGERLMLLDPNGRPLWGGPGRAGAAGQATAGQGAAGQHGTQAATATQGQQGAAGQGNQGNGGWGQQASPANGAAAQTGIPAAQWQTLTGNVTAVEPLAIGMQTTSGDRVRVELGLTDFWTQQGYVFVIPESITIMGFWAGDVFQAGQITFNDGTGTLYFRDAQGALLWGSAASGQSANGRQYRGGR